MKNPSPLKNLNQNILHEDDHAKKCNFTFYHFLIFGVRYKFKCNSEKRYMC